MNRFLRLSSSLALCALLAVPAAAGAARDDFDLSASGISSSGYAQQLGAPKSTSAAPTGRTNARARTPAIIPFFKQITSATIYSRNREYMKKASPEGGSPRRALRSYKV